MIPITHDEQPCKEAIVGFEEVKPMVFAGIYPIENEDFEELRDSLENFSSTMHPLSRDGIFSCPWFLDFVVDFRHAALGNYSRKVIKGI